MATNPTDEGAVTTMTHPALLILFPQIFLVVSAGLLLFAFQQRTIGKRWIGAIGLLIFVAAGVGKVWLSSRVPATGVAEIGVDPHAETLQWIMLGVGGIFAGLISQRPCSRAVPQNARECSCSPRPGVCWRRLPTTWCC